MLRDLIESFLETFFTLAGICVIGFLVLFIGLTIIDYLGWYSFLILLLFLLFWKTNYDDVKYRRR